jgi:hypothetical protein
MIVEKTSSGPVVGLGSGLEIAYSFHRFAGMLACKT